MTKEQELKIQLLKDFTKMDFSNPMGWTGYYDTELKELSEAIETVLSMIEKRDKQIDLMATTLSAICTGISTVREQFEKEYCEFMNSDEDCCWKTDASCKDCIKQYFERKSKI